MRELSRLQYAQRDRIVEALMAGLSTEILQLAAAEGLEDIIEVPEPSNYYIVGVNEFTQLVLHDKVAVVISPTRDTVYQQRLSGNGLRGSAITESYLAAAIVFPAVSGFTAVTRRGRPLGETELGAVLSSIYTGAMLEVLLRDAVDGQVILDLFPTRDYADSISSEQLPTVYRSVVELSVRGQGSHPHPQYQLARQAP